MLSAPALQAAAVRGVGDGDGGTGGGGGTFSQPAATPGPAYPWEGSVYDVKTGNGDKLTSIPIVAWKQQGGLPIELTLNHNSESSRSGELGAKWATSYDDTLSVDASGNVTVYWGDGRTYTFLRDPYGSYTAPKGIYDTLTANSGQTSQTYYTLKNRDQVSFTFTVSTSSNIFLLNNIYDINSNTDSRRITFGYVTGTKLIQTISDATGRITRFSYDANNRLSSVTDPLNRKWTLSYDANSNLAHIYWPVYNGSTYSINLGYDANHNITSYQDLRGNTSTFAYNAADNTIAWEKDACNNQTTFQYGVDANGAANAMDTTIVDPNGHKTVHTYNAAGQLASITDALGYTEYYSYDGANNVTQKQDKRGSLWKYTYDGMGNVLTSTPPGGSATKITYNAYNNITTVTAPSGRSAAGVYDAYDNLTQVQEKNSSGTVLATTKFTIGAYGLVSDKYDANNHHTAYAYDANGYLSNTTTPLGSITRWTHDALGFQTSRLDAMGRTTTYTPDPWERRVTTTYPDGSTNRYVLDANSNLVSFGNYVGTWSRVYDADNRMTSESYGGTRDNTHTYDGPGQKGLLSSMTDYDGRVVSYTYSARGELASVGDNAGTESYAYDAGGNQTRRFLANSLRVDENYNPDGTLHSYYNWNGTNTVLSSYGYAYNADHQIVGLNEGTSFDVDANPGPTQSTYVYDGQGHLTSESRTGNSPYSTSYAVDGAGNRTLYYDGYSSAFAYDADDEVKTIDGSAYGFSYNANGDRTGETNGGQVTTFGYDYDDQLVSLTKPGTTEAFAYDAIGRQVNKTVNGVLTGYYPDGEQIVLEKVNGVNTAQYLWGNGLARCNREFPLADGRGNVRQSTNASQSITSANAPTAFGIGSLTGGTASAYSYGAGSGYRQDGVAPVGLPGSYALQKVGARYYDPGVGGFLTRDTDLSQSPYAYCDGDPVNFNDPSGHKKKKDPLKSTPTPTGPSGAGSGERGPGASGGGGGGGGVSAGGSNAEANKGMLHTVVDGVAGGTVGLFTAAAFAPLMTPIGSGIMAVAAGSAAAGLADYYLTKAGY